MKTQLMVLMTFNSIATNGKTFDYPLVTIFLRVAFFSGHRVQWECSGLVLGGWTVPWPRRLAETKGR